VPLAGLREAVVPSRAPADHADGHGTTLSAQPTQPSPAPVRSDDGAGVPLPTPAPRLCQRRPSATSSLWTARRRPTPRDGGGVERVPAAPRPTARVGGPRPPPRRARPKSWRALPRARWKVGVVETRPRARGRAFRVGRPDPNPPTAGVRLTRPGRETPGVRGPCAPGAGDGGARGKTAARRQARADSEPLSCG